MPEGCHETLRRYSNVAAPHNYGFVTSYANIIKQSFFYLAPPTNQFAVTPNHAKYDD